MKTYLIKSFDTVAGLMVITIHGNGEGLQNRSKITDNNGNVFIINSIAMTGGKNTINDETVLAVDIAQFDKPIGTEIYYQS